MHLNPSVAPNVSRFCASLDSKLRTLVQRGQYKEALQLYSREDPHTPCVSSPHFAFPPLLKACAALSTIRHGKTVHAQIIRRGLQFDAYVATSLVNMYIRCGSLLYATQVFANMSEHEHLARDVTLWNATIDGYFRFGEFVRGINQFIRMQLLGVTPDSYSLSILLGACSNGPVSEPFVLAKQIHGFIVRNVLYGDPFLDTALIRVYLSCGLVAYAWHVFQNLEDKHNIVVWNAMITGLSGTGLWKTSLQLFSLAKAEGCQLASASFTGALSACSQGENVLFGQQIHSNAIKVGFEFDPFVSTSLLTMYSRCGLVVDAELVFDGVPDKQIELWNSMISAYVNHGLELDALDAFVQLKRSNTVSDSFTISNVLSACCRIAFYDFGKSLHAEFIKRPVQSNVAVLSALLTLYLKHENMEDAEAIFDTIEEKDVVAWGSMISGFCENGDIGRAVDLFRAMVMNEVKADSSIMSSLISACAGLDYLNFGHSIHGFIIKSGLCSDVFVASSLIELYSKGGSVANAEKVFFLMPHKNIVAWNSMISCYCQNGKPEKSISIFPEIMQYGLHPDSVSITIVLSAVASSAGLLKGKTIHGYLVRKGIESDIQVDNAMLDMYIKCGSLSYAQNLFQTMPRRNLISWNSIISGYGSHGQCKEAIHLFEQMKGLNTMPDDVTFLSLIMSCSHSGFVDQGLKLFHSIKSQYNMEPTMEHYANVVDLLGRAGRLEEAFRFVESMPIEAGQSIWQCLLSACRAHRNLKLAELAAQNLRRVEPSSTTTSSDFVQLLNLYGEKGLWDKAASLRAWMKETGTKKVPGCSWIEVKHQTSAFVSGDSSSLQTVEICDMLNRLKVEMERNEEEYNEVFGCS